MKIALILQGRENGGHVRDQHVDRIERLAINRAHGSDVLAALRLELIEQATQRVDRVLDLTGIDRSRSDQERDQRAE